MVAIPSTFNQLDLIIHTFKLAGVDRIFAVADYAKEVTKQAFAKCLHLLAGNLGPGSDRAKTFLFKNITHFYTLF